MGNGDYTLYGAGCLEVLEVILVGQ
jgi:hypothetical protein